MKCAWRSCFTQWIRNICSRGSSPWARRTGFEAVCQGRMDVGERLAGEPVTPGQQQPPQPSSADESSNSQDTIAPASPGEGRGEETNPHRLLAKYRQVTSCCGASVLDTCGGFHYSNRDKAHLI